MKKEWLVKTFALGIVGLFISVSFQPIIAEKTISIEKESNNENIDFEDVKDYLFQTIIDNANNPDVKELYEQYNYKMFNSDLDYKSIFSQLLFKKPRLLKSMFFTRPKMTYEYLEKNYNTGVELVNILGEDEALEIIESIKINNKEVLNEINKIIMSNGELTDRVTTLAELNIETKFNSPLLKYPIICNILLLIFLSLSIVYEFFIIPLEIFKNSILLKILVLPWIIMIEIITMPIFILLMLLECLYIPIPK